MKKSVPNIISGARAVGALALLLLDYPSWAFFVVFALCGVSDVADGYLARRLDAQSKRGAQLDTAADLVLVVVCCVKVLPALALPWWLWLWVALIAVVKGVVFATAWRRGRAEELHSAANKIMGLALLVSVFIVPVVHPFWLAVVLCAIGTLAAADDCRRIAAFQKKDE